MHPSWAAVVAILSAVPLPAAADDPSVAHPAHELKIEATIPAGGDFMTYGFGALWLAGGNHIYRVNPKTDAVTAIELPDAYGGFRAPAIGEGAVWVASAPAGLIYRVDPDQNQVTLQIAAKMWESEGSIAIDFGSLWAVVSFDKPERTLARFDAQTGKLLAQIALPGGGAGVAVAGGAIWVTSPMQGEVFRIDPATDTVTATVETGGQPRFIAADGEALWILDQSGGVQRVDTGSAASVASIPLGPRFGGGDITVGGGSVWVSLHDTPVIQIDPEINQVRAVYEGGGMGDAIRFGAGSLWVSGDSLTRIAPPE